MNTTPENLLDFLEIYPLIRNERDSHVPATVYLGALLSEIGEDIKILHRTHALVESEDSGNEPNWGNTYHFKWNEQMFWAFGKTSDEELFYYIGKRLEMNFSELDKPLYEGKIVQEIEIPLEGDMHNWLGHGRNLPLFEHLSGWKVSFKAFLEQNQLQEVIPKVVQEQILEHKLKINRI